MQCVTANPFSIIKIANVLGKEQMNFWFICKLHLYRLGNIFWPGKNRLDGRERLVKSTVHGKII